MRKKKIIRINSMSYCAVSAQYTTLWEDVWLVFKDRRKTVHYGPCIMSLANLENDLILYQELRAEHLVKIQNEKSEFVDFCGGSSEINQQDIIDDYSWYIRTCESAKAELEAGSRYVILEDQDLENDCPNIVTKATELNRQEIEDALAWFLRSKGYLKKNTDFRFKWKRPNLFVQSVTI